MSESMWKRHTPSQGLRLPWELELPCGKIRKDIHYTLFTLRNFINQHKFTLAKNHVCTSEFSELDCWLHSPSCRHITLLPSVGHEYTRRHQLANSHDNNKMYNQSTFWSHSRARKIASLLNEAWQPTPSVPFLLWQNWRQTSDCPNLASRATVFRAVINPKLPLSWF